MQDPTFHGEHLREVVFPLGGIGTGSIGLEGRGAFRDWEIFNRPNKNTILPSTFAALWARPEGGEADARVIQGPPQRDFIGNPVEGYGFGLPRGQGDGLPHFSEAVFTGRFPRAHLDFHEPGHSLKVSLDAWSPFIPLDPEASGMPVACLAYRLRNTSLRPVEVSLAFNLWNPVGSRVATDRPPDEEPQAVNRLREGDHARGLVMGHDGLAADDPRFGTVALATDHPDTQSLAHWPRPPEARWFDGAHAFWDAFASSGALPDRAHDTEPGRATSGSLALRARLAPGEATTLPVFLTWCFPNFERYWWWHEARDGERPVWRNWYATQWGDAFEAAEDFARRRGELEGRTRAFERVLHDTSLPAEAVASAANTATTLRTPTVLRYEDGTFWAWEGCSPHSGCCPGSCTHVWNYAQTHAFLFPSLQRSMRRAEYEHSMPDTDEGAAGKVSFRIPLPLEQPVVSGTGKAAVDGQLGGVLQLYRDWRYDGDDAHLRRLWPNARQALEYAWTVWDTDRDGLIESEQHNTYDIEFRGPNPLAQFLYLGALRAGEEIARHLGETDAADTYRQLFERGRQRTEERLFQEQYFVQPDVAGDDRDPKYQHGRGCLSDQLLGQLGARLAGLGQLADPEKVRTALRAIYTHNFRDPLGDHANPQRVYAVADEPGLLLCSWPEGGRPPYPFVYSDEVWTGIEYQVATHLILEGMRDEGLHLLRGVRRRYDGARRNPYNEIECGSHYARALASWGALVGLSGFGYDAVTQTITLTARDADDTPVRALFTTGTGWGRFTWQDGRLRLELEEGELAVARVEAPKGTWEASSGPCTVGAGEEAVFDLVG